VHGIVINRLAFRKEQSFSFKNDNQQFMQQCSNLTWVAVHGKIHPEQGAK